MSREVEGKFRVASHTLVRERLVGAGAEPLGRVLESNLIYDSRDGRLREGGCGLRLRTTKSEQTGDQETTLTYKGPVEPGPYKTREELEISVDNADAAASMLERLGYVRILEYQKRRESWRYRNCRVELDEPPHVGLFVEIEGPDTAAVRDAQDALGLADAPHEPASYVRMLWAHCEQEGLPVRVLRFSDAAR